MGNEQLEMCHYLSKESMELFWEEDNSLIKHRLEIILGKLQHT